jgi:magnesium transporter
VTPLGFEKSNPPVGARPGTLAIPPGSPPPEIQVVRWSESDVHVEQVREPARLAESAATPGFCWVDVRGLGDEALLREIGRVFAIHPLALEDAVNVPQRAKSEVYPGHHLVIARVPVRDADGELRCPQVCLLIGERCLLTFQERAFGFFEPVRERLRAGGGPMRRLGPDYLAYALVDALVDRYYPIVHSLGEEVEELEDQVTEDADPGLLARIHALRRQLVVVRRVGWPQREAVASLLSGHSRFVSDEVRTYLRDVADHIAQIMELVDSAHELALGLVELHLSMLSHRTNEVMKVLTIMASIFIPLSFIAGVYGMNFDHMPELHHPRGYALALGLMACIAGGLLLFFRRRGWLGRPRRRAAGRSSRPPDRG